MSNVELISKYMAARTAGDIDAVMGMVSDDIVLESSRDGTKSGAAEFKAYIAANAASGTWEDPQEQDDGTVVVNGSVTFAWVIPVNVKGVFTIKDGKITHIVLAKR